MLEKPREWEIPEGIGAKMWHVAIKLLAEQYGVDIKYELKEVKKRDNEDTA